MKVSKLTISETESMRFMANKDNILNFINDISRVSCEESGRSADGWCITCKAREIMKKIHSDPEKPKEPDFRWIACTPISARFPWRSAADLFAKSRNSIVWDSFFPGELYTKFNLECDKNTHYRIDSVDKHWEITPL